MIAAVLSPKDDSDTDRNVMLILEPANIAKLQLGSPIVKCLNDFFPDLPCKINIFLSYTPDIVWVGQRLSIGEDLADTVRASLSRPEVFTRTLDPEALKRGEIAAKPTSR